MSSEQTEITERYIQEVQWSDRATEHEKALVAGNIRQFAHGVMRPLIAVKEHEKKMLRADLTALREQLAAKDKRIAELEAVVGKLPVDVDGKLICLGKRYTTFIGGGTDDLLARSYVLAADDEVWIGLAVNPQSKPVYRPPNQLKQAARAAAEQGGGE